MVSIVSLLPLTAAGLSIVLAALALTTSRRPNLTVRYFSLLNAGTALWCFTHFIQLNMPGPADAVLAAPGSPMHALLVVQAIGVAASPTYGFLFAASYAKKMEWTKGWRLGLVHVPLVYTFAAAATNPWHHLFVAGIRNGSYTYGPLAPFHQLAGFVLGGISTYLILSSSWRRGTAASRRQAIVIGLASLVSLAGGIVWALRHQLGLQLTVNLSPVLAPVVAVALTYELVRTGLADIVPYATMQAFNAISDAALALDHQGGIAAMNTAAKALFPAAEIGVKLAEVAPDLGSAIGTCLSSAASYTGFDLERGDRVYWGRVRPTRDQRGIPMGCIVLLTDVTEVRMTQSKLLQLGLEAGSG